jgi:hypothetical protein
VVFAVLASLLFLLLAPIALVLRLRAAPRGWLPPRRAT